MEKLSHETKNLLERNHLDSEDDNVADNLIDHLFKALKYSNPYIHVLFCITLFEGHFVN
jgi:beta-lactamase regulating signal transducer with metallopeptidase domain